MTKDKHSHRYCSPNQAYFCLEGNVDELEAPLGYLNEQYQLKTTFQFKENQIDHEEYQKVIKVRSH
jgi:hypothetical protein